MITPAALSTTKRGNKGEVVKRKFTGKCHWCQKSGHMMYEYLSKKAGKPQIKQQANVAINSQMPAAAIPKFIQEEVKFGIMEKGDAKMESLAPQEDEIWIVDSGASHHYTDNENSYTLITRFLMAVYQRLDKKHWKSL